MASLTSACILLVLFSFSGKTQTASTAYVGSKACFGCHSDIYKSFQKTDMGRSMRPAAEWNPQASPSEATINQPGTARKFSVAKTSTGWSQTEFEPDVFSVNHQLDYVVGSGYNGLSFLIRRGRYLFQAPLSYYTRAQKWDLSPGYENVDLGFSRRVPEECINCHAGRPSPIENTAGEYADPPFQELAIGCENCHGPGRSHVTSAGKTAGLIVNPAKLKPGLADNICINCHQTGDARVTQAGKTYLDFKPGQWLFDTAIIFKQPANAADQQSDLLTHYTAMQASRCFRESAGKMNCLSCHDPHTQPRKEDVAAYYRPKCLTCHNDESCRIPLAARVARTPSDDCAGCHMPKRNVTQISHSALTNHRIPARPDEPLPLLKQDVRDGLVVVNPPGGSAPSLSNLILLRAYRQMMQKYPDYRQRYESVLNDLGQSQPQDAFVQAALGSRALDEGKEDDAVSHLKLALPIGNPAIFLELGQSLAKLERTEEAIDYLKKGVVLDPYDAVMQKTLILQYINTKSYADAQKLMQSYVTEFPEDSLMRNLLNRVSK